MVRAKIVFMLPVAAVLGFVAIQAGRHYLDRQMGERIRLADLSNKRVESQTFGTIVVAAAPLRFGAELAPNVLREIPWPEGQMPKGAYRRIADLVAEKDKRFVLAAMEDNEPVLASKITGPGQRANLAAMLDEGMKAITVRVDDVIGVAGFVLPGDRVDVMLMRHTEKGLGMSDVILQNLKVLAIDQLTDDRANKPALARTVTLEVATAQAQRLVLAHNVGNLTLVLRHTGETANETNRRVTTADLTSGDAAPSTRPTSDDIVASFHSSTVTVGVMRRSERQEYSVPSARKE